MKNQIRFYLFIITMLAYAIVYSLLTRATQSFTWGELFLGIITLGVSYGISRWWNFQESTRTSAEIQNLHEEIRLLRTQLNSQSRQTKEDRREELQLQMQKEDIQGIDFETGLFNDTASHIFLNKAAKHAKRHGLDFGIMYLGLNDYQKWEDPNEIQIHIKQFADDILITIRESDLAFYMDKGEYLLILEGCGQEGGEFILKRIENHLASHDRKNLDFSSGLSILTDNNSHLIYSLLEDSKIIMANKRDVAQNKK